MRATATFVLGLAIGYGCLGLQAQQPSRMKLNHVGLRVNNFEQAVRFYRDTMGFPEAFSFKRDDGSPRFTYLQISRETFLELQPASTEQPAGFLHIGLDVEDLPATLLRLQSAGLTVTGPNMGQAGAPIGAATAPDGTRMELLQLGPESLHRKAMDRWR